MNHHTAEEKQLCQYLLGKLAEDEQRQLEEQLMTQDNLLEQLEVLEDELIDEYLRNTLSDKDRREFRETLPVITRAPSEAEIRSSVPKLCCGCKRRKGKRTFKVFALADLVGNVAGSRAPALSYGLPVAILGAFLGCLWMAGTIQRLQTEVAQVRTEQGSFQEREQQLQQQLEEQRRRSQELEQQWF